MPHRLDPWYFDLQVSNFHVTSSLYLLIISKVRLYFTGKGNKVLMLFKNVSIHFHYCFSSRIFSVETVLTVTQGIVF